MKGSMTTDLGVITIEPDVVAKYAGTVAVECFGIVGMAAVSMKDGLVKLLKKESLTHGIQGKYKKVEHINLQEKTEKTASELCASEVQTCSF